LLIWFILSKKKEKNEKDGGRNYNDDELQYETTGLNGPVEGRANFIR